MTVLILGAGPSGTSCAIQLCKFGFDVTIIDNTSFPRFRPGESCHPGIEPLLKQLDVWEEVRKINPMRNKSIWIVSNGIEQEEFYNKEKTWEGFQFPREEFDSILLNKAIELGAHFLPTIKTYGVTIDKDRVSSIETNKGQFKADIFIDATGSKSILAVKLKIKKNLYSNRILTSYTQIASMQNLEHKYNSYFEVTKNYWGYISLIKPSIYSITYSSHNYNYLSDNHFINKHFRNSCLREAYKKYDTSWAMISEYQFENIFFVGDALMSFDPTSSKGVLKSIMTGIYLSHVLHSFKIKGFFFNNVMLFYKNWYINFFHRELNNVKSLLPKSMSNKIFMVGVN